MNVFRDADAVNGDDGAVLRDGAAAFAQGAHRADGHVVRDGKHGGKIGGGAQTLLHGGVGVGNGEVFGADQVLRMLRETKIAQRALIAQIAELGDRAVVGIGGQHGDAAVTVFVKLADRAVGLLLVGDGDGGVRLRRKHTVGVGVGAADIGHAEKRNLFGRIIAAPAEEDNAAQALFLFHHRTALNLVVARWDLAHDHRVARGVELLLNGVNDVGVEGVLHAAHHEADRVGADLDEVARAVVRHIPVRLDDGADPSAGIFTHVRTVVEHAGDGADAHVCKLCNILDGHADAPPAMIPETLPVTFPILAYSIAPTAGKVK